MTTTHDISADFVVITREPWIDGKGKDHIATIGHLDLFCSLIERSQVVPAGQMAQFMSPAWPCNQCGPGATDASDWQPRTAAPAESRSEPTGHKTSGGEAFVALPAADVERWLSGLGRKVDLDEVTEPLRLAATEWAKAWDGDFEFMVDMRKAAGQARGLSRGQAKGVLNCWRADLGRRPAVKAPALTETGVPGQDATPPIAKSESTSTGLDLSGMVPGCYAVPGGDTRLKVRIDRPTEGKWAGWVFVKDAAVYGEGRRYGSQRPGALYSGAIIDALAAILADPKAASAAYGHLTSTCGVCGTALEQKDSVERGIGPVCATKWG